MSQAKWNQNRITIDLMADALGPEESIRDICPTCWGGSTKEKSFVMARDHTGKIMFKCFRATCSTKGTIYRDFSWPQHEAQRKDLQSFTHEYEELTDLQKEYFDKAFDIEDLRGVYYCRPMDCYVFKVEGPRSEVRGWQARRFGEDRFDKSFKTCFGEFIGWIRPRMINTDVVVVEDYISALKVAEAGYNVVCLLGTVMNWARAFEIAEFANIVHFALDKGQTAKMIEYREKYGILWRETIIWSLDKDLKYVPHLRIKKAMEDGEVDFRSHPGT